LLPAAATFQHSRCRHSCPAHCLPRPPSPFNWAGCGRFGASLELRLCAATRSPNAGGSSDQRVTGQP
jgi:hypothetical protein